METWAALRWWATGGLEIGYLILATLSLGD